MLQLESILSSGLLLTPELIRFSRQTADGFTHRDPVEVLQRRFCLTQLQPHEVPGHASRFGEITLEFEHDTVRRFGAVPVIYVPNPIDMNVEKGFDQIAITLVNQLEQLTIALQKAESTWQAAREHENLPELILGVDGQRYRIPPQHLSSTFALQFGQPSQLSQLLASAQALSCFFYPAEAVNEHVLTYYREREWRVIAEVTSKDRNLDQPLAATEIERIAEIDPGIAKRRLRTRNGEIEFLAECRIIREFEDRPLRKFIRRILVADHLFDEVAAIAGHWGLHDRSQSLSSLSVSINSNKDHI